MSKLKKRLTQYNLPVTVEPCEEGGFFATCPALPGCFVEGDTIPRTLEYLEDAIEQFIQSYHEHGDPLPEIVRTFEAKQKTERQYPISFLLPIRLATP